MHGDLMAEAAQMVGSRHTRRPGADDQHALAGIDADGGETFLISGGLLLLWYALVRYNESTEKFHPDVNPSHF
ncbi:MAG: hypothetical protein IPJ25_11220 [Rhodocyclaceae bacterium]|nr:hypothetical protein [Rhodocyclaceae bacterium]